MCDVLQYKFCIIQYMKNNSVSQVIMITIIRNK